MSKILYILYRNPSSEQQKLDVEKIKVIGERILPDNIEPNKLQIITSKDSICAVYNPVSTIAIKDCSVCMGYTPNQNWFEMNLKSENIEGSFAIFRNSNDYFQLVTDMVASRSIWYFKNDSLFIASSSQRAIIMYLGSFEFNNKVTPWMLSSGTLGPGYSYDRRLSLLEPNTIITLNKINWETIKESEIIELRNSFNSKKEAKEELRKVLKQVINKFEFDKSRFVLPLSGGYDSRGILLHIKEKENLKTITWGTKEALFEKVNDAFIADRLAFKYKTKHTYFESYNYDVSLAESINRFIINSEGRIDHIGGYLDGMAMWAEFFERGYECLIRGDELIGLGIPVSQLDARRSSKITILSDYYNISQDFINKFPHQELPLEKYKELYKDKGLFAIYYEHPIAFAALNDIKLSYVEIFNPLLSSSILKTVFTMFNEKNIGDKISFKRIVDELCPDIPIAQKGANKPIGDILSSSEMCDEVINCFKSWSETDVVEKDVVEYVSLKLANKGALKSSKIEIMKKWIPKKLFRMIKGSTPKRILDWNILAFRLYIIIRMGRMFNQDAKLFINENSNK
jgi:hypothetical protein